MAGWCARSLSRCRHVSRALFLAGTLVVVACGGGNGNGNGNGNGGERPNTAPTANAGQAQTANPGATVTLDGSGSRDAEGGALSFAWAQGSAGTRVTLSGAATATPTFTAPAVTENADIVFSLTVTDADGLDSAVATVTVTINAPPTADAGEDQTTSPGAVVTLDGGGSSDPGGGEVEYAWTLPAGTDVTLSDAEVAAPTFTAPAVTEDTEYILTLTVTDEDGAEATDTVTVAVNVPPVADAGDDQTVSPGVRVILDGSGSSHPGGGDLEYSWALTTGTGVTLFGEDEARPTFTAPAAATDATYTFTLTVTAENGAVATDTVTIIVRAPGTVTMDDPVSAGDTVTISGPANANAVGYAWRQVGGPTVVLDDPAAAAPTFTAPAVATDTTLTFEVTVADADGTTQTTTVEVVVAAPTNQAPVARAGADGTENPGAIVTLDGSASTDADGDDLTYAWTPASGAGFALSGADTATATFTAPDVTQDTLYTFTLTVTDGNGGMDTDEVVVTVNTPPSADAGEDDTVNPGATVTLDGSGSANADGSKDNLRHAWAPTSGAGFTLSGADTATATFTAPDVMQDTLYTFTLTVTDGNGGMDTDEVTITIGAQLTAIAGDDETVAPGAVVTLDGSGSFDPGGTVSTYAWSQPSGQTIALSSTAVAMPTFTAPAASAVREDTDLTFTLTVTDMEGQTDTDEVTITIEAQLTAIAVADETVVAPGAVVTLDGSGSFDPGGTVSTYAWSQPSGQTIALSSATVAMPTFTAPTTPSIRGTVLTFTLTVTANGKTAQDTVTVSGGTDLLAMEDHEGTVRGVSISRDGTLAVSGGLDGTVRLWNANTGAAIHTLGRHDGPVFAVAINADGTRAISGGGDGTVRLWTWDGTGGLEVKYDDGAGGTRSLGDEGVWVYAVALNKDGTRAASGGFDGAVRVWNTATSGANAGGEITYDDADTPETETDSLGSHGRNSVYGVSLSDDGRRVLSGGADGTVRLWNAVNGEEVASLTDGATVGDGGPMGAVFGVSLSGDGTVAAAGSADNNVHVWNAATGAETHELTGHAADVSGVSLNAAKTRVLSAGGDGAVRFWNVDANDAANNGVIRTLRQHADYAWSASLSGDGVVAVSGGGDGKLHLWNTGAQPADTTEPFATAEEDRDAAATGDVHSRVLKVNPTDTTSHASDVFGVSLSADGRLALSGGDDDTVRLWDAATGAHLRTLTGHTDGVAGVSLSADGRLALSGSSDNSARLWDAATGAHLHTLTGHTYGVVGVSLSADGRLALSGSQDNTVRLWDAATGAHLRTLTGHTDIVRGVSLSADGRLALSGSSDNSVRLWDVEASPAMHLRTLTGHTFWVNGVSLSADGRLALSGSWDNSARLWDAATGAHLRTLTGHTNRIIDVSLSADGRLALSGSQDNTVRLWGAATGAHLRTLTGHTDAVRGVSLSADGRLALSGSSDNSARLWSLGRSSVATVPTTAEASAGEDRPEASASVVTLDGSGSTDSHSRATNGKPLAYYWRQTAPADMTLSAADTVTLSANNTETATFTAPTVTTNATLVFALTVTDQRGLVDTDEVTITVTPSSSGRAPRSLTGAALGDGSAIASNVPAPTRDAARPGAAAASDAARVAGPACASAGRRAGRIAGGRKHGPHCIYAAALFDAGGPLETDMVIPALPNGGAHVFRGSLVVGGERDADAGAARAGDGPTLAIEQGAILAFEGATSGLVVKAGARLLAVGTAAQPITLTSRGDAEGGDASGVWGGIQIHGNGGTSDSGHLEFVVVKAVAADAAANAGSSDATPAKAEPPIRRGAITLHNVGGGTVARNLQVYAAAGDGLVLHDGSVRVENFVSVYARGNSIDITADWSGSLRHALVIQPQHGGEHCLHVQGANPGQAREGEAAPRATISGLTCITSAHTGTGATPNLGAGIRLGATAALTIERSLVIGTFSDDTDVRAASADVQGTASKSAEVLDNPDTRAYCLRVDGATPRATRATLTEPTEVGPALVGNVFACEDKTVGAVTATWATSRNNQFADVAVPTDPTAATDTHLQLLGGTPPVYSLDYQDLRINGADATITPPNGAAFPGAASQSAAPSWLRPGGVDWTHGIFEGSRDQPLWFEPDQ